MEKERKIKIAAARAAENKKLDEVRSEYKKQVDEVRAKEGVKAAKLFE